LFAELAAFLSSRCSLAHLSPGAPCRFQCAAVPSRVCVRLCCPYLGVDPSNCPAVRQHDCLSCLCACPCSQSLGRSVSRTLLAQEMMDAVEESGAFPGHVEFVGEEGAAGKLVSNKATREALGCAHPMSVCLSVPLSSRQAVIHGSHITWIACYTSAAKPRPLLSYRRRLLWSSQILNSAVHLSVRSIPACPIFPACLPVCLSVRPVFPYLAACLPARLSVRSVPACPVFPTCLPVRSCHGTQGWLLCLTGALSIRWLPKHASFEEFMREGARDFYTNADVLPVGAPHA
jgi:hypothetical protein